MAAITLRLPDDVHAALRATAAEHGVSIQETVTANLRRTFLGGSPGLDDHRPLTTPEPPDLRVHVPAVLVGEPSGGPWEIGDPIGKLNAKYFAVGRAICWKTMDFEVYRARSRRSECWQDRLEGADLMATHMMNSRLRDVEAFALMGQAPKIEAALKDLPDEDLAEVELRHVRPALRALFQGFRVNGIGLAKVTKILALKRNRLVPMLDRYVISALFGRSAGGTPRDPAEFADLAIDAMTRFRELMLWSDGVRSNLPVLRYVTFKVEEAIGAHLRVTSTISERVDISPVRVLDSLIWFDWWGHDYFGYRWNRQARCVERDPRAAITVPPEDAEDE